MTNARVRGGYALFSAMLLVHIALYTLTEPRSSSFLVLAGVLIVFALTGTAASLTYPRWLETARRLFRRAHLVYLLFTLIICFGFGVQSRPEWLYVHAGLWLILTLTLGYALLYRDARPVSRRLIVIAVAIFVPVILIVRLYGLSVYPLIQFTDEPWVLGWAIQYARTGQLFDRIMAFGGYEVTTFAIPFGWWVRFMGTGFFESRLFFFVCTLLLIGLTTLAARRLYDRKVAALTAVFMFASAVVMAGMRIRHDIGLALAVAASLWVYGEAIYRHNRWLHALAGLIIGLGVFIHYHAAIFGAALAVALYLPNWFAGKRSKGLLPESDFWVFVFGGMTAAIMFILVRLLPTTHAGVLERVLRLPADVGHFVEMVATYFNVIGQFSLFEWVLVVVAIAGALWRRGRFDVSLVIALLLMHIGLGVFAAAVLGDYYILPISPLYGILIAELFVRGLRRADAPQPDGDPPQIGWLRFRFTAGLSTAFLMAGMTLALPLAHLIQRQPVPLQPSPAVEWLRSHIETDRTLVAQHWYYLFLTDYHFISPYSTAYMSADERLGYVNDEAVWDDIKPDYVVIDPNFGDFCFAQVICQTDYLVSRGYHVVAEFPGERETIAVYASPQAGENPS